MVIVRAHSSWGCLWPPGQLREHCRPLAACAHRGQMQGHSCHVAPVGTKGVPKAVDPHPSTCSLTSRHMQAPQGLAWCPLLLAACTRLLMLLPLSTAASWGIVVSL